MTEWIVPLAGILIFLFFCPGCFLWVWLHNRKTITRRREVRVRAGAATAQGAAPHLAGVGA